MPRTISFIKMNGLGNDYVFLDLVKRPLKLDFAAFARRVSDRHFGVGSDGLIVLVKGKRERFRMRMWNADGSESEMCGNGIRCLARLVHQRHSKARVQTFETGAGPITTRIVKTGEPYEVEVDMGEPVLEPGRIPVVSETNEVAISDGEKEHTAFAVSMGNPHAVIFVEHFDWEWAETGRRLEHSALFPNKTNVEFVQVLVRDHLRVRVWERGSGVTMACGTGACASLVAAVMTNRAEREATLTLDGGNLRILWDKNTNRILMTGPAAVNFTGVIST